MAGSSIKKPPARSLKVLIVEDHRIVLEGLRTLFEKRPEFKVVGEAQNGEVAVTRTRELSPDVVIMDITLPGISGVEATRQILALGQGVKVIMLSMHAEQQFIVDAFAAGASGYLLKGCAFEELHRAILAAMSDQVYLSPSISKGVVHDYIHYLRNQPGGDTPPLSPREKTIIKFLADGRNNKQIAVALNVSIKTIEAQRLQIMRKAGLQGIADLTKFAIRVGLTDV